MRRLLVTPSRIALSKPGASVNSAVATDFLFDLASASNLVCVVGGSGASATLNQAVTQAAAAAANPNNVAYPPGNSTWQTGMGVFFTYDIAVPHGLGYVPVALASDYLDFDPATGFWGYEAQHVVDATALTIRVKAAIRWNGGSSFSLVDRWNNNFAVPSRMSADWKTYGLTSTLSWNVFRQPM